MKRQRRNDFFVGQVVGRLKEYRQARNLTQETVSDHTRLNIGRIETGRHDISLSTLAILCDYYNVPPRELFQDIVTHSSCREDRP
ncbi:helix-turn-helix transcriptional regulator [uncultured Alistipes sp.]|jgi:transcriptional regulator with XRE-family HTH domain|uniref:helix-turn-helix transcriptional regulator n=1 Tax=uncultured Alistipes sp. TaxID=538949 RepID=UPI0025CEF76B|nr:helix-turn-helix transcriptional regulator [uncultured Alistipes sp.]